MAAATSASLAGTGRLARARAAGKGLVLSCSALKKSYRDLLRSGAPELQLVYLQGEVALLRQRMASRVGHYMPLSLLASQLTTLEEPTMEENALCFDVACQPEDIVRAVLAHQRASDIAGGAAAD